jgi:hypothetical protein
LSSIAVPQLVLPGQPRIARGQPDQRRRDDAGVDRQAAEQRRGPLGEAAVAGLVDGAHAPRETHRQRRQHRGQRRGHDERVQRF